MKMKTSKRSGKTQRKIPAPAARPNVQKILTTTDFSDVARAGVRYAAALATKDKPIIFAYHGYPSLIHRLTYRRTNHPNLHVRGYKEEGTTSTPFDMVVMNDLDRFHPVADVIDRVPKLGAGAAYAKQAVHDKLIEHKRYIAEYGEDMPEIRNWKWVSAK